MARLISLIVLVIISASAKADQTFVVQFGPGSNWQSGLAYENQPGIEPHFGYWQILYGQEVLLMSGPFDDESGGIFVVRAKDREAVNAILADDPAVKTKIISVDVRRWRILSSAMRRATPQLIELEPDQSFRVKRVDPDSPINLPQN